MCSYFFYNFVAERKEVVMLHSIFKVLFFIIVIALTIFTPIGMIAAVIYCFIDADAFSDDTKATYKHTKEQKQIEQQRRAWKRNIRYMK